MSFDFPIFLIFLAIPLVAAGQRLGVPYPLVLVIGGLLISLIPGVPAVPLEPEIVLLVVLPPLLFWEAYAAPVGQMRTNAGWVLTLSVTLVLVTIIAVAFCVRSLEPNCPWAVAIMLGAIVAPTDTVAFAFVAERCGIPRRLKAIVQGESLFNDALALVLFVAALNAAMEGSFTPGHDIGLFFRTAVLSIGFGVIVGWLTIGLLFKLKGTELQTAILVVLPFMAYLPAVHFDLSGILAVVSAGIVMSTSSSHVTTYLTRLRFGGFSQTGAFLINAVLFLLIGLQLRVVGEDPSSRSPSRLLFDAVVLNIVVFAVRFLWVYGRGFVMRLFGHPLDPRYIAVIAWSGMRGSVSLAAAVSIPYAVVSGATFPDRHFVLYMTFSVIIVTLVGQGLTLDPLVRALGLREKGGDDEEMAGMRAIGNRALLAIAGLEASGAAPEVTVALRRRFGRFSGAFADTLDDTSGNLQHEADLRAATLRVIAEQRRTLDDLGHKRRIDYSTQKEIERLLDLQEAETALISVALQPRLDALHAFNHSDAASSPQDRSKNA